MNNIPEQDTSGLAVYSVNLFAEEYIYEKVAQGEENCASGLVKVNRDILVYVEQGLEDQLRLLDGKILFRQEKRIIEFDAVFNGDGNGMMLASQRNHCLPLSLFMVDRIAALLMLLMSGIRYIF
jgi:hypothetical protein